MDYGGSFSNYKWELVGVNIQTNERIAFPCSPNSVGTIVNQVAIEGAEGLWEIPEEVKETLKNILSKGTITLELLSKIAKTGEEKLMQYLNEENSGFKFPSDSVFMLMELAKNLDSENR